MENEEKDVQEEVVEQEEITTTEEVQNQEETEVEQTEETEDDVVTLKGEEKAEYEKWKAKKEERRKFSEQAKKQPTQFNVSAEKLERIELRQEGYSKDEVDAIMQLGGAKALSNPIVQSAVEAMRAKAKSDNVKQPLNSKSPVYKKYTQEDINNMSVAELEKILPKG